MGLLFDLHIAFVIPPAPCDKTRSCNITSAKASHWALPPAFQSHCSKAGSSSAGKEIPPPPFFLNSNVHDRVHITPNLTMRDECNRGHQIKLGSTIILPFQVPQVTSAIQDFRSRSGTRFLLDETRNTSYDSLIKNIKCWLKNIKIRGWLVALIVDGRMML
jgi:hypothetical protein